MAIFKTKDKKLVPIKEKTVGLERDLQKITEDNLETVFGLKCISSEFSVHNMRIDTLAYDEESRSFVIIEYKRDRSFSVIDQGFSYLANMLNNKAEFILEFNEKAKKNLKRGDVDWSQSRVLFLANSFTQFQRNAINFKDLPIELWEVKVFDNDTILYNLLKSPEAKASIKSVSKSKTIVSVSKEVKKYSVDDHFKEGWDKSNDLFEELREKILGLDDRIEENPTKYYIGYRIGRNNFVALNVQKAKIRVELLRVKPKDLKDPEGRVEYSKHSFKYYHKHISLFDVKKQEDLDYALFLIKQVYEKFGK